MPLSGAERSRRYREKMKQDPTKYQQYLEKERQRYSQKKTDGQVKLVADVSERERRRRRKYWREMKKKQTPETPAPSEELTSMSCQTEKKKMGRKRVKRERSKTYRAMKKLEHELKVQKKVNEKLRKRIYRAKQKNIDPNSPRMKVKMIFKGPNSTEKAKKMLLFHNVLLESIKEKYRINKSERSKQLITKAVLCNRLLKKYRLQKFAKETLDITQRRIKIADQNLSFMRKTQKNCLVANMKQSVSDFLNRNDNSRVKAGKRSTKTQHKIKKQIRLLNDTMKNLHMKFLAEEKKSMSYAMFCRLRPFHIRPPTEKDRETCLCRRHENLIMKARRLKEEHVLQTENISDIMKKVVCDTSSKDCMYRVCPQCKDKRLNLIQESDENESKMVNFYEWKTKRVEVKLSNGDTKMTSMTVKERDTLSLAVLCDEFDKELRNCSQHVYNIEHQYKAIRELKEKLTTHDVLIHVDFSENLTCKYESEIQSVHFGASQRQLSLHTGVIYTASQTQPFCSVSDNLAHNPTGIWAHVRPVLKMIRERNPDIVNVFFLSDGPTTQYKNKENFYMMSSIPFGLGFRSVNWSYTEAGHGKGAPDGVGAVVKRASDRLVSHGTDVTGAQQLCTLLNTNNLHVQMFYIPDEEFTVSTNHNLQTVKGTLKIHQVFSTSQHMVSYRDVSCFCKAPMTCNCYSPLVNTFSTDTNLQQTCSSTESQMIQPTSDQPEPPTSDQPQPTTSDQSQPPTCDQPEPPTSDQPQPPTSVLSDITVDDSLLHQYCVVKYDNVPYPGLITNVESSGDGLEVSVLHSVGDNRFFWPRMEDVCVYAMDDVLTLIPPPKQITRHYQVDSEIWRNVKDHLNV